MPDRRYIDNRTYRAQKSALTRAINSGDPIRVLDTVEKTLYAWEGKVWPDGWHRWHVALADAFWQYSRDNGLYDLHPSELHGDIGHRFRYVAGKF